MDIQSIYNLYHRYIKGADIINLCKEVNISKDELYRNWLGLGLTIGLTLTDKLTLPSNKNIIDNCINDLSRVEILKKEFPEVDPYQILQIMKQVYGEEYVGSVTHLTDNKIELLPHNQMLYDKIVKEIENGERSIFYSQATGLGKSFIFMRLVQDYFMDKKILYIVPKIAIWNNLINYSDFNKLNKDNIEMATYASFNNYDTSLSDKYDVVFVDECHHMLSDIQGANVGLFLQDVIRKGGYTFGLTATPEYKGTFVDERYFSVSCYGYSVYEAIEQGIFPKIKLAMAGIDLNEIPSDMKAKYSITGTQSLIERILEEHNNANKWLAYFPTKQELNDAVDELNTLFPDFSIYKVYDEYNRDNKGEIEKFTKCDGKTILLSVGMLLEGIHLPEIDGILLYRNVVEFTTYLQIYGRLCNINTLKTPVFVDMSNTVLKFRNRRIQVKNRGTIVKNYDPKDLFDVTARDYWTVELADILDNIAPIWTEEEDDILKKYYPSLGSRVVEFLPGRARTAISKRAYKLGISYETSRYTDWEDEIIRKEFPQFGTTVCSKLNNRSPSSVTQRASVLGVVYTGVSYLDEEVELVRTRRAQGVSARVIAEELNNMECNVSRGIVRYEYNVKHMVKKYNIKLHEKLFSNENMMVLDKYKFEPTRINICCRLLNMKSSQVLTKYTGFSEKPIPYTLKEMIFIRDNMNDLSIEDLTISMNETISVTNRTCEGVLDHIKVINGEFKYCMKWTDDEIKILREDYPTKGMNYIQHILFYRRLSGISTKLSELGIKVCK